jgi:pantoate--beta-alanine ligase
VLVLGQKDAQQTAVLRKLVRDLAFEVSVEVVPTIRERDGLAMSSRNSYLTPEQRPQAATLYRALLAMRDAFDRGGSKDAAVAAARAALSPSATPDYFDVVDADSFEPVERPDGSAFIIGAARFGSVRLIDNVRVPAGAERT